jgi:hypothetical protein
MMSQSFVKRRGILVGGVAVFITGAVPFAARAATLAIHVSRDPNCGCCGAWIDILQRDGFTVTDEHLGPHDLLHYKRQAGIPDAMFSCHTGLIDDYVIEGHVPTADIRRLLSERPDAIGLSVPGMPYGSPGMGPEHEREAYDVHLIRRDGQTEIFSRYAAA